MKAQYVLAAQAKISLEFARKVAESLAQTLDLHRQRYPKVIDEGQLARVEVEKLEADQNVTQANGKCPRNRDQTRSG